MIRLVLIMASTALVATVFACGSGKKATSTSGGKLTVSGGALGTMASATMQTSAGASCTITYIHPSGKTATAQGLTPKIAGPDGVVSWTWLISTGTKPQGLGTVTVDCGSDKQSAPITISAAVSAPSEPAQTPLAVTPTATVKPTQP